MKKILTVIFVFVFAVPMLSGCENKKSGITQEMPADFRIYFSYWVSPEQANIYDTYNGKIQKDLIADGTVTADLTVTNETLNEIYQKLIELEIHTITEDMTSENLSVSGNRTFVSPCTEYQVIFTMNGAEYKVAGDDTGKGYSSADHFWEFIEFMQDIYQGTEEYQAFPDAESGYLY